MVLLSILLFFKISFNLMMKKRKRKRKEENVGIKKGFRSGGITHTHTRINQESRERGMQKTIKK